MPTIQTFHFTRRSDSDFHPILGVSLTNSVSYYLYKDQKVEAALITNSSKTIAQFIGEGRYTIDASGFLLKSVKRRFTTEDKEVYADILIKRPFFGKDKYLVHFSNEEVNYTFQYHNTNPMPDNRFVDFKADLLKDDQVVCTLKNFRPRNKIYDPRTTYLEGVIELRNGAEKEKVFVLIQTLQLYFELDML